MEKTCPYSCPQNSQYEQCIVGAVYSRLLRWGGSTKSLKDRWLPANKVRLLQELVRDYVETYNLERELLDQLPGWTCALGQIIDTDDDKVVTKLPYILTAYIYNFGEPATVRDREGSNRAGNTNRNRYVYSYLQKIENERKDFTNDEFFGVSPGHNRPKEERVGIGALFNEEFHSEDARQRSKLKALAGNFVFPETDIRWSTSIFPNLVPAENLDAIQKQYGEPDCSLGIGGPVQKGLGYDGRALGVGTFWNVFLSWCYTLLQRRKQECQVASKVDFLCSTCLMCHAIHREDDVNLIKNKIEAEGRPAAQEWIENQLISRYEETHEGFEQAVEYNNIDGEPEEDVFRIMPGTFTDDNPDLP